LDHARKEFGQRWFKVGAGVRKHLLARVINREGHPARKVCGQMVERLGQTDDTGQLRNSLFLESKWIA
jgi:hypothetical protein